MRSVWNSVPNVVHLLRGVIQNQYKTNKISAKILPRNFTEISALSINFVYIHMYAPFPKLYVKNRELNFSR